MSDDYSGHEPRLGGERRQEPPSSPGAERRARPHLRQALRYIEEGHWEEAAASLRFVTQILPNSSMALGLLSLVVEVVRSGGRDPERIAAVHAYTAELMGESAPSDPVALPGAETAPPAPAPPAPPPAPQSATPPGDEEEVAAEKYAPPGVLEYLEWLLLAPERLTLYRMTYGQDVLRGTGASLANALLWLPLTIALTGIAIVRAAGGGSLWGWLLPAGTLALWALTGWVAQHGGLPVILPVAAAVMVITAFFTGGIIGIAAGLVLPAALLLAVGVTPALAEIDVGRVTNRFAGGVAVTLDTVLAAFVYPSLMGISRTMVSGITSPAGSMPILVKGGAAITGGLALMAIFMLGFAPFFLVTAAIVHQAGFFMSGFMESTLETNSALGSIVVFVLILLANAILTGLCLMRMWQVLI
ncbi:MAG: hypothetical protein Kow00124_07140 [Anaerolineae bacterium]